MNLAIALAALAAAAQPAPAAAAQPDLDWLAGYWLSCEDGRDVSETWSVRRGGVLLGFAVTTGTQAFSWEQMRIEAGLPGPNDMSFFAQPRGAETATPFRLVRSGPREAVFENMANDFPKRVIYRREGDRLTGRIEGAEGQALEWRYNAAPLNSRCPR
ncbi:MAG TPA: DUF6265 family protein [Allosphingosinicella sp.]|jgi:hypothetical protein